MAVAAAAAYAQFAPHHDFIVHLDTVEPPRSGVANLDLLLINGGNQVEALEDAIVQDPRGCPIVFGRPTVVPPGGAILEPIRIPIPKSGFPRELISNGAVSLSLHFTIADRRQNSRVDAIDSHVAAAVIVPVDQMGHATAFPAGWLYKIGNHNLYVEDYPEIADQILPRCKHLNIYYD